MVGAQGEGGCKRSIPDRGGGERWSLVEIIGERLFRVVKNASWVSEMLSGFGVGTCFGGVAGLLVSASRQKSFP